MSGCLKKSFMLLGVIVVMTCLCGGALTMWGAVDLADEPSPTQAPDGPYHVGATVRVASASDVDAVPIGDEERVFLWYSPRREQSTCTINVGAQLDLRDHVYRDGAHWYQGVNDILGCGGWIPADGLERN